jgi:hypothetical protein
LLAVNIFQIFRPAPQGLGRSGAFFAASRRNLFFWGGLSSGLRPDAFFAHPAPGGIPFFLFLFLKFSFGIFFKKSSDVVQ